MTAAVVFLNEKRCTQNKALQLPCSHHLVYNLQRSASLSVSNKQQISNSPANTPLTLCRAETVVASL